VGFDFGRGMRFEAKLTFFAIILDKQKNGLINAHYPGPGNAYMDSIAAPVWEELDVVRDKSAKL